MEWGTPSSKPSSSSFSLTHILFMYMCEHECVWSPTSAFLFPIQLILLIYKLHFLGMHSLLPLGKKMTTDNSQAILLTAKHISTPVHFCVHTHTHTHTQTHTSTPFIQFKFRLYKCMVFIDLGLVSWQPLSWGWHSLIIDRHTVVMWMWLTMGNNF